MNLARNPKVRDLEHVLCWYCGARMGLDMIRSRMRVGSNGPPLHMFDPTPIREYWVQNRHKVAEMVKSRNSDDSRVIQRLRKTDEKRYTSTLFL